MLLSRFIEDKFVNLGGDLEMNPAPMNTYLKWPMILQTSRDPILPIVGRAGVRGVAVSIQYIFVSPYINILLK